MIVCPTPNDWCAELWQLTAYIKSTVLAHTVRYQTNSSLYDYNSLKSVCSSPSHILEWHICPWPRCSFIYCISSRTKPVFSQTILTAWPHSPTSLNAKTVAALSKPLSSIVPHFGGKKRAGLALHLTSNQKSKCKSGMVFFLLFFLAVSHKTTCCFKTFAFVSFNLPCGWILLLQPFSHSLQTAVAGFS